MPHLVSWSEVPTGELRGPQGWQDDSSLCCTLFFSPGRGRDRRSSSTSLCEVSAMIDSPPLPSWCGRHFHCQTPPPKVWCLSGSTTILCQVLMSMYRKREYRWRLFQAATYAHDHIIYFMSHHITLYNITYADALGEGGGGSPPPRLAGPHFSALQL